MKKPHACGTNEWVITRVGVDIKLKCINCNREIMMDRLEFEKKLYKEGINLIAGVDEVGRGPLVGPVVASAVILPKNYKLEGLTDSKKLSEKKRNLFFDIIKRDAIAIGVGVISEKIIDEYLSKNEERSCITLKDVEELPFK